MTVWRIEKAPPTREGAPAGSYDLVVVGGGPWRAQGWYEPARKTVYFGVYSPWNRGEYHATHCKEDAAVFVLSRLEQGRQEAIAARPVVRAKKRVNKYRGKTAFFIRAINHVFARAKNEHWQYSFDF